MMPEVKVPPKVTLGLAEIRGMPAETPGKMTALLGPPNPRQKVLKVVVAKALVLKVVESMLTITGLRQSDKKHQAKVFLPSDWKLNTTNHRT
jgi:hypothetical protein